MGPWRTTSTGQWAWRTTESETLPSKARLRASEPTASQDDKVGVLILGKAHYLFVRIAERKIGVANLDPLGP